MPSGNKPLAEPKMTKIYASVGQSELTHCPQDKMADILQRAFWNVLSWKKIFVFDWKFLQQFVAVRPVENMSVLVEVMAYHVCCQSIIWTNTDLPVSGVYHSYKICTTITTQCKKYPHVTHVKEHTKNIQTLIHLTCRYNQITHKWKT